MKIRLSHLKQVIAYFLFICLLNCILVQPKIYAQPSIYGGDNTEIWEAPYIASLGPPVTVDGEEFIFHECGAVILSCDWVLTAAHCVYGVDISELMLHVGTTDQLDNVEGQSVEIDFAVMHPSFEFEAPYTGDLALLHLKTPLDLNCKVQSIQYASKSNTTLDDIASGTKSFIAGWGDPNPTFPGPNILQSAFTSIISNADANVLLDVPENECYPDNGEFANGKMIAFHEAGSGIAAGNGDSGGPAVITMPDGRPMLIGISSWGGCPKDMFPTIYVNVREYATWINQYVGSCGRCQQGSCYTKNIINTDTGCKVGCYTICCDGRLSIAGLSTATYIKLYDPSADCNDPTTPQTEPCILCNHWANPGGEACENFWEFPVNTVTADNQIWLEFQSSGGFADGCGDFTEFINLSNDFPEIEALCDDTSGPCDCSDIDKSCLNLEVNQCEEIFGCIDVNCLPDCWESIDWNVQLGDFNHTLIDGGTSFNRSISQFQNFYEDAIVTATIHLSNGSTCELSKTVFVNCTDCDCSKITNECVDLFVEGEPQTCHTLNAFVDVNCLPEDACFSGVDWRIQLGSIDLTFVDEGASYTWDIPSGYFNHFIVVTAIIQLDDGQSCEATSQILLECGNGPGDGGGEKNKTEETNQISEEIRLYPNPAKSTISINNPFDKTIIATIYNTSGQQYLSTILDAKSNSSLDLLDYPQGVYFVRFTDQISNEYLRTEKIILID